MDQQSVWPCDHKHKKILINNVAWVCTNCGRQLDELQDYEYEGLYYLKCREQKRTIPSKLPFTNTLTLYELDCIMSIYTNVLNKVHKGRLRDTFLIMSFNVFHEFYKLDQSAKKSICSCFR